MRAIRTERDLPRLAHTARSSTRLMTIQEGALRTLLYYDLWEFPLTALELHLFHPVPTSLAPHTALLLESRNAKSPILEHQGYFFVKGRTEGIVLRRQARERHARWMWRVARISGHIIKRFPYVRAILISGELSKNATGPGSDVDFFILTEPGRLWIARTMLILFKKIVLFNRKKFFCLNSFRSTGDLTVREHDLFTATEIAHLKPLYNVSLFSEFMERNRWVKDYFPNFRWQALPSPRPGNRRSLFQILVEGIMSVLPLDRIDTFLMKSMQRVWANRYPQYERAIRERILRCTKDESRAYIGDFQDKILAQYRMNLLRFGILA